MRVDAAVSAEVLRAISPLAIEAAFRMRLRIASGRVGTASGSASLRLSRRATRRRERGGSMTRLNLRTGWWPLNSSGDGTSVSRRSERIEDEIRTVRDDQPAGISAMTTRANVAGARPMISRALWNHPAASAETRKRILRTVLEEIVVTVELDRLQLKLHWKGGDHTGWKSPKNRNGSSIAGRPIRQPNELIHELARPTAGPAASLRF